MYGYILPDKPNMYMKDFALYRAFYCGTCKIIGGKFGTLPRLTTNYDITFIEIFLHSYLGVLPEYAQKTCIAAPFKRKHVVNANPLLERIIDLNIIMSYHKLIDDVTDGGGGKKRIQKSLLKRAYKKAKKRENAIDAIVASQYKALLGLERLKSPSIDQVADTFATMLRECARELAGERSSEDYLSFCYNVGRYIYLMDALDDLDSDARAKRYNPYLAAYPDYTGDKQEYVKRHYDDIAFSLNVTVNRIIEDYNNLGLTEGKNLLDNIVHLGLRRKLRQNLEADKEMPREKI